MLIVIFLMVKEQDGTFKERLSDILVIFVHPPAANPSRHWTP